MRDRNEYDSRARARKPLRGPAWICAQRLLAGLLVLAGLAQCPLRAQTDAAKAAGPTDRYLLIVETSKSMQRRADAVVGTVQDLLKSSLDGQFRDGGTLGIWTFNEDLSTGRFPLQVWSSSAQKDITQRTVTFLKGQSYEKQASFDKLLPALSRVIKDSKRITVILISSGDWKMQGTPFDDRINASYQQWRDQQQKARMPFVTVLRARNGEVAAYAVNTPPWPLQLPHVVEEPKSIETVQEKPREVQRNAPTSAVPPLIISGKKPKPEPGPAPLVEPVPANALSPSSVAAAALTNQPATITLTPSAAPPAEVAKADSARVVPEKPAVEPPLKPAPAPIAASEPKPEEVKAPEAKPTVPAPAKPEAATAPAASASKPQAVADEKPKHSPQPGVNAESSPLPVATREAQPSVIPSVTAAQATTTSPSTLAPPAAIRPGPPAQAGTAAPGESLLRVKVIWIAALVLVLGAIGAAFLLMRRQRAVSQASLITRSFEREKRP